MLYIYVYISTIVFMRGVYFPPLRTKAVFRSVDVLAAHSKKTNSLNSPKRAELEKEFWGRGCPASPRWLTQVVINFENRRGWTVFSHDFC